MLVAILLCAQAILPRSLPPATVGKPYSAGPLVVPGGGLCPRNYVTFGVVSGAWPEGIAMSAAGYFSGTPRQAGEYAVVARAANACSFHDQEFRLTVLDPPTFRVEPSAVRIAHRWMEPEPLPVRVRLSSEPAGAAYRIEAPPVPWLRVRPLEAGLLELSFPGMLPGRWEGSLWITAWHGRPAELRLALEVSLPEVATVPSPPSTALRPAPPPPPVVLPPRNEPVVIRPVAPPKPAARPRFGYRGR